MCKEKCSQCGRMLPVWSDDTPDTEIDDCVSWSVDPYLSEMFGDYEEMWLCGYCEYQSQQEI